MPESLTKKEVLAFLPDIDEKCLSNYLTKSKELSCFKEGSRWRILKDDLVVWDNLRKNRTISLDMETYKKCFQFAMKMVYGGLSLNGIRGQRSEVQASDDVILGILAEHAIKKFLLDKFGVEIELDEEVHTEYITPQDFDKIKVNGVFKKPSLGVGIKASKFKSAYLVLGANEVDLVERRSDIYIFARVNLPSDHLFRILRDHSFFKTTREFFENNQGFKKIEPLNDVSVWICGFTYVSELEKTREIPGQTFDGDRYVKSVSKMRNSDEEWREFIKKLKG